MKTAGVLPIEIAKLIGGKEEEKAIQFAKNHVTKLNKKEDYQKRFQDIKSRNANGDETHMHINIFDEAHYGATSNQGDNQTAYQIYANEWNSQDYPRVINIMVSATPWNLQTVNTKFESTEVGEKEGELVIVKNQTERRKFKRTFFMYEVDWTLSHGGKFNRGRKLRLMVSSSFKYLLTVGAN